MVAAGEILGGKYQAEYVLGHGGMGLVIAARHLHLDQRVAIKLLNREHLSQPAIVERFLREARASVRLRSEHVARVLDAGQFDDGMPFLVMEYLEGRDLAKELAAVGRLPVATAVELVLQACEAVAEAHQAGIVHRDLKPANLFVTRDGDGAPLLKVLDFGISKVADDGGSDLTTTKMVMGSPPYMSPEQLRMSRSVDVRADVWSLGVVLYELVAGRRPFVGLTLTDLVLRIAGDPPDALVPDGPLGLEAVIARCLAKSPADRFASVAELAAALVPFGGPSAGLRYERILRRAVAPSASASLPIAVASDGERTTLSSANGSVEPRPARLRARPVVIGAALGVIAVAAAVALWPGRSATVPASQSEVAPAASATAPLRPAGSSVPAAVAAGSAAAGAGSTATAGAGSAAAGAGSTATAGAGSAAAGAGSAAAGAGSAAAGAGSAAVGAGSAAAAEAAAASPASKPRATDSRRSAPAGKPPRVPARRPPAPPPVVEDLTKSQY